MTSKQAASGRTSNAQRPMNHRLWWNITTIAGLLYPSSQLGMRSVVSRLAHARVAVA